MLRFTVITFIIFTVIGCEKAPTHTLRSYGTSFESVKEFENLDFYITPPGYMNTSFHELNDSIVKNGSYAHKAWINGENPPSITSNNNHRAYPAIQLYKTEEGAFTTPCYVTLWIWLDMPLINRSNGEDDWFSIATFSCDDSDNWSKTVLVNLNYDGYVHLMHVPEQGRQEHIFQTDQITFPQKQWVKIKVYLDFSSNGYAKVWQDGELVSHAKVSDVENELAQAHFGLYCPPQMTYGIVYNDDLTIEMIDGE